MFISFVALLFLAIPAGSAYALPIDVSDFATDPSGAQFTIGPVSTGDPGSINLATDPTLEYGVTSPDGTANTMQMSWQMATEGVEAQAGWELIFGEDPDLTGQVISLSINPPGGWVNFKGNPVPNPGDPTKAKPDVFQGITSLEVRAIDMAGALAGSWGFNTDQALLNPPANDPLMAGGVSLLCNVMQTVNINVGLPIAGSAIVSGDPMGPWIGPNFSTGGHGNFTNIGTLQFFENGVLAGNLNVVPGQTVPGLNNYWDHITVTPEPSIATLLFLGIGGLAMRRVNRRSR